MVAVFFVSFLLLALRSFLPADVCDSVSSLCILIYYMRRHHRLLCTFPAVPAAANRLAGVATSSAVIFRIDASCVNGIYLYYFSIWPNKKATRGCSCSSMHAVDRLHLSILRVRLHTNCTYWYLGFPHYDCASNSSPAFLQERGHLTHAPLTRQTRRVTRTTHHPANSGSSAGSAQSRRRTCGCSVPIPMRGHSRS